MKNKTLRSGRYRVVENAERSRGVTLLEVAAALSIGALVVAAGIVTYSGSNDTYGSDDALSELTAIRTTVNSFLASQGDYNGLSTPLLAQRGGLDSRWVSGTNMVNGFKGSVVVNQYSDLAYSVSFSGVPPASCMKLLTTDYGSELSSLSTNNGQLTLTEHAAVQPSAAQAACRPRANGTTDVTWVFGDPAATVGLPITIASIPAPAPAPAVTPSAPTVPSGPGTKTTYSTPVVIHPAPAATPAPTAPPAVAPVVAPTSPSAPPVTPAAPPAPPAASPAPAPAVVPSVPAVTTAPVPPSPNPYTRADGYGAYVVHLLADGTWTGQGYEVYQDISNSGTGYSDVPGNDNPQFEINKYYTFGGTLTSYGSDTGTCSGYDTCWKMTMNNYNYSIYDSPYPGNNVFDDSVDFNSHTLITPSTTNSTLLGSGSYSSNIITNYMNIQHSNYLPNLSYGEWDSNFGGIGANINLTSAGQAYFAPFTGGTASNQIEYLSYINSSGTQRQDDGNGGSYFSMGLYAATGLMQYPGDTGYTAP